MEFSNFWNLNILYTGIFARSISFCNITEHFHFLSQKHHENFTDSIKHNKCNIFSLVHWLDTDTLSIALELIDIYNRFSIILKWTILWLDTYQFFSFHWSWLIAEPQENCVATTANVHTGHTKLTNIGKRRRKIDIVVLLIYMFKDPQTLFIFITPRS